MLKRNMMREIEEEASEKAAKRLEEEEEAEEKAATRVRKSPKQPDAAPNISILMEMEAIPFPERCQAYAIMMEDSFLDAAREARDPDVLLASSVCQGDYYKVGYVNDRAVFKQEEPQFPSTTPMYVWFSAYGKEQGWLVTDKLRDSEATREDAEIYMWFEGDSTLPGAPHLPYWANEVAEGITSDQTLIVQAMMLEKSTF